MLLYFIIFVIVFIILLYTHTKCEHFDTEINKNDIIYSRYPYVEYVDWEYGRRMFDSLTYYS